MRMKPFSLAGSTLMLKPKEKYALPSRPIEALMSVGDRPSVWKRKVPGPTLPLRLSLRPSLSVAV